MTRLPSQKASNRPSKPLPFLAPAGQQMLERGAELPGRSREPFRHQQRRILRFPEADRESVIAQGREEGGEALGDHVVDMIGFL